MKKNENEAGPEVRVLEKEIMPYVAKAQKLVVIKNEKDMALASEMRTQLKAYEKQVIAKKEEGTAPLNLALKNIRSWFKPLEERIDESLESINSAMIKYQTEQKKKADEEAEKIANRVGDGKGKLKAETAMKKIDDLDTPQKTVKTASGGTQFITVKKFEVMDLQELAKVKDKQGGFYILADESRIRVAMKAGIELPGVRYYTEEVPRNI